MSLQLDRTLIGEDAGQIVERLIGEALRLRGMNNASYDDVLRNPGLLHQRETSHQRQFAELPENALTTFSNEVLAEGRRQMPTIGLFQRRTVDNPLDAVVRIPRIAEYDLPEELQDPEGFRALEVSRYDDVGRYIPWLVHVLKWTSTESGVLPSYVTDAMAEASESHGRKREMMAFEGTSSYRVRNATYSSPGLDQAGINTTAPAVDWGSKAANQYGQYLSETLNVTARFAGDQQTGTYDLLVSNVTYSQMGNDHSPGVAVRNRILADGRVRSIVPSDGIPTPANAYFLNAGSRTVRWIDAIPPTVIMWASDPGFTRYAMLVSKAAPAIIPTVSGKYGVQRII